MRASAASAFEDDNSLVLVGDAHRYGITMDIDSSNADTDGDFVIQCVQRRGLQQHPHNVACVRAGVT